MSTVSGGTTSTLANTLKTTITDGIFFRSYPYDPVVLRGTPFVSDFERGTWPWFPASSTRRVPTDRLGGEWAVLLDGDEISALFLAPDPVDLALRVSYDGPLQSAEMDLDFDCLGICSVLGTPSPGAHVPLVAADGNAAVSIPIGIEGEFAISIRTRGRAFVDDIAFPPTPEPASAALVGGALPGLAAPTRRRRGQRRGPAPDPAPEP